MSFPQFPIRNDSSSTHSANFWLQSASHHSASCPTSIGSRDNLWISATSHRPHTDTASLRSSDYLIWQQPHGTTDCRQVVFPLIAMHSTAVPHCTIPELHLVQPILFVLNQPLWQCHGVGLNHCTAVIRERACGHRFNSLLGHSHLAHCSGKIDVIRCRGKQRPDFPMVISRAKRFCAGCKTERHAVVVKGVVKKREKRFVTTWQQLHHGSSWQHSCTERPFDINRWLASVVSLWHRVQSPHPTQQSRSRHHSMTIEESPLLTPYRLSSLIPHHLITFNNHAITWWR